MQNRILTVVAITCLVALAGCSAGPSLGDTTTPDENSTPTATDAAATDTDAADAGTDESETASTSATETSSETATASATATETSSETATETSESWTHPELPNKPMEDKTNASSEPRISSVEVVNTVASETGSGYSNFDLAVHANTSMPRVDPASHGTVDGEPYFLVYVNGQLLERSKYVVHDENGTFEITMRKDGGFDRFDAGELDLTVKLVDRDSEYDDVYGVWNGSVQYAP
ncbi:hypothetical protein [Halosimplex salinum]|uniref:hypothetical protein n=1 Tax=Halosimplex salinum TaxID=1710538 RepID=UPI000F45F53F|nr:hypothetical protein [Halosimplex salinum]